MTGGQNVVTIIIILSGFGREIRVGGTLAIASDAMWTQKGECK
jgi:hypothetical protein